MGSGLVRPFSSSNDPEFERLMLHLHSLNTNGCLCWAIVTDDPPQFPLKNLNHLFGWSYTWQVGHTPTPLLTHTITHPTHACIQHTHTAHTCIQHKHTRTHPTHIHAQIHAVKSISNIKRAKIEINAEAEMKRQFFTMEWKSWKGGFGI